jgi:serine/threonine protein kinase
MPIRTTTSQFPKTGDYEILSKIADGGMGSVYKGRNRATGQIVAIKVVTPEVAANPVLVERFKQEYRAARGLIHPHIVRALDFGFDDGTLYMIMEYVDGPSVGQRIDSEGPLPEAEAVRIIAQAAEALHVAHQHQIIHRDVKPDNILIASNGEAKLTDLGLAKNRQSALDLTRPLSGLGTPNFMSPEQFGDAKHADVRCDVYSLGATLYMAVTGELPFWGKTNLNILKKKMANEIAAPITRVPSLSPRVDAAIRKAIRAKADERHASCLEFISDLTGTVLTATPPATHVTAAPRPARAAPTLANMPSTNVAPPPRSDRRAAVRFSTSLETSCQPTCRIKERSWSGRIQDISSTGVCLLLRRRFEPGTILTAELHGAAQSITKTMLIRVLRVQEQARRRWSIGCAFDRELSELELKALL